MCGINGIVTRDNTIKRKISALNQLLKHRGPDDEGFVMINSASGEFKQCTGDDSIAEIKSKHPHIDSVNPENFDVILAQRRLAIIDLSCNGHGPMPGVDNKIWISYNGEIYNYIELRDELKALGYKFTTETDTEVIINSYLCWGADCLSRFNGMWGFAIWDSRKQELFIARDRFGVKPVYYSLTENYFAYSSEIKPLTLLLGSKPGINKSKIPFFVLYGNRLNTPDTYIKDINSLQGSHYLIYKDGKASVHRYYDVQAVHSNENEEELKDKIVSLLSDSIKLRFRSDVPVGTCLSGGFDSSSIVSLSSRLNQHKLQTFSAVWKEKECDESKYIDIVNEKFGCVPNKTVPSAGEFEKVFTQMSWYQEIPTEGPGLYPQWYVMAKAKGNVKVLLDGQGGDEVFGGYFLMGAYLRGMLRDKKLLKIISEFNYFTSFLNKNGIHSFASWLFPKQYSRIARTKLSEKFKIINKNILDSTDKELLELDLEPPKKFPSYINNLSYHFITNFTIPTLLHYEDRSSMAHSIESRVPFLDYRLVELGLNLKPSQLTHKGVSRPLFRKAVHPYLPDEIVNRKDKLGYPVPFTVWTRTILKDYVSDVLLDKNALIYEYIDSAQVIRNLENHFSGLKDYSWEIWRLLSLENFMSLYKDMNYTKIN
jgi:asparagine synthase (glutamine-hydrolysing)